MIRIVRCTLPREALILLSEQIELLCRKKEGPLTLALSGGETARALFTLWREEFAESIPWEQIRFYWVDERCVPPSNTESNYALAHKLLLGPLGISPRHIFRIRGECTPTTEARRYETLLQETLPIRHGTPQLDAMILGAGADGHTASIFPGNETLFRTHSLCEVSTHPTSGQKRITLTGRMIFNSKALLLPIVDPSKAPLIGRLLDEPLQSTSLPAGYVIAHARNLSVYSLSQLPACPIDSSGIREQQPLDTEAQNR